MGIGICGAVLCILLRQVRPELSMLLGILTGTMLFLGVSSELGTILGTLEDLAVKANLDFLYFPLILKTVGIATVGEFAGAVCRDAKEDAIALKITFGAKVLILLTALPVMTALVNVLLEIIG